MTADVGPGSGDTGARSRLRRAILAWVPWVVIAACVVAPPWRAYDGDGRRLESLGHAPLFSPPEHQRARPPRRAGYAVVPPERNSRVDTRRLAAYLLAIGALSWVGLRATREPRTERAERRP